MEGLELPPRWVDGRSWDPWKVLGPMEYYYSILRGLRLGSQLAMGTVLEELTTFLPLPGEVSEVT